MMYGRRVSFELKPNALTEFTRHQETEIVPLLRKQKGFQNAVTLVAADQKSVQAISIWDRMEDAEAYDRTGFKEVSKLLASVAEGTPKVESVEVATSTIHKTSTR
jgi:quinol monooxygenase YgiN